MSSLAQLREGLNRAWDNMAEGWQHLRQRASQALTRFNPIHHDNGLETVSDQAMLRGARWGLLSADIEERNDSVVVRLEAPGMNKDDFDISVIDSYLVVRGEKYARREQSEGRYTVTECAYGSFERAFDLPAMVDESQARASYKRGVLTVSLPKHAQARQRRVKIDS
ncbi:MAG: Hsp20/alpha crystallin family protein [Proteobacteria bacterium]|jgi:HSP20 family protein|nr:Hsp20/alpha crystallin family protein [Pseudomonadota bacterium]